MENSIGGPSATRQADIGINRIVAARNISIERYQRACETRFCNVVVKLKNPPARSTRNIASDHSGSKYFATIDFRLYHTDAKNFLILFFPQWNFLLFFLYQIEYDRYDNCVTIFDSLTNFVAVSWRSLSLFQRTKQRVWICICYETRLYAYFEQIRGEVNSLDPRIRDPRSRRTRTISISQSVLLLRIRSVFSTVVRQSFDSVGIERDA